MTQETLTRHEHPCQGPECEQGADPTSPGTLIVDCTYASEYVKTKDEWPKRFCSRVCLGTWAAEQRAVFEAWLEKERKRVEAQTEASA